MYNEFLNLKKMERLWSGHASGSSCCSSKRLSLQSRALTLHLGGFLELRMQRGLQVNTGAWINILQWLLEWKTTTQGAFYSVSLLCQIGIYSRFPENLLSDFCSVLICHSWSWRGEWKGGKDLIWDPSYSTKSLCAGQGFYSVPIDSILKKKKSGPKLATRVKKKMVLQMEYRFKESVYLPTSWGLPIALLSPTQTPETSPSVNNSH